MGTLKLSNMMCADRLVLTRSTLNVSSGIRVGRSLPPTTVQGRAFSVEVTARGCRAKCECAGMAPNSFDTKQHSRSALNRNAEMPSMRDDLREQAVQIDVQGLVVHHPCGIWAPKRGVRAQSSIVRFNDGSRSTRDRSQKLHHTKCSPRIFDGECNCPRTRSTTERDSEANTRFEPESDECDTDVVQIFASKTSHCRATVSTR